MENRIKSAFDHLADTDIEKINQQNIDLTAPDGAAERIEALVMKKIATSPESDTAPDDTAAAIILKKPCKKRIFRRATIIAAAAILAFAMTFGIAAQTGKIRQIFWFGSDGIESAEIIGTGEEEPIPTGFYYMKEAVTLDKITLNYAIIYPSDNSTSSLRLYATSARVAFVGSDFRMYITLPDGSEYSDLSPFTTGGSYGSKVISVIEGIPTLEGEAYSFTLHIECSGKSYSTGITLPAADKTLFEDRLSTVEWNGLIIQALTFPGDFNAVLVRLSLDSEKCELPELKKIIAAAEQDRFNLHFRLISVSLYSADGTRSKGSSGSGRSTIYDNYMLIESSDPDFVPAYISYNAIIINCGQRIKNYTFEETYGVDMYVLISEGLTADKGFSVNFASLGENSDETVSSVHSTLIIDTDDEITIPLKK